MNDPGSNKSRAANEIEAVATSWVMRRDHGVNSEGEQAFAQWLAADTRHRGAYLQAEAAFMLAAGGDLAPSSATDAPPIADDDKNDEKIVPRLSRRSMLAEAAGAAAILALVMAFWPSGDRYETALGEIRRVPLADGSVAAINTESAITVDLREESRSVNLKKGEAFFQVAHDPVRPFTVAAGEVRVRAVGTAFGVRRYAEGSEIVVSEGAVEAWSKNAAGNRIRLKAGERTFVSVLPTKADTKPALAETAAAVPAIDRALAWREGKIELAGESLAYAVAQFNRYNDRKIVLGNKAVGQERFYGIFRTDDPEGFAQAVQSSLGVGVTYPTAKAIRIGE